VTEARVAESATFWQRAAEWTFGVGGAVPPAAPVEAASRSARLQVANSVHDLAGCDLVVEAIVEKLKPLATKVKTMTFDSSREITGHAQINEQFQSTT
jgi:3-hydroxyacyl-CoA dehydrogenase